MAESSRQHSRSAGSYFHLVGADGILAGTFDSNIERASFVCCDSIESSRLEASDLIERLNRFNLKRVSAQDRIRVLVVDDEPANRTLLTKALEPAGFTVFPASGGREAIELAKSLQPDLVLLDLMMPEVTGFDVVEALRANESTRDTPIMVLTATSLSEADKRLLNGRVSKILSRGSVATTDIVGLLKRVVAHRNGLT